MDLTLAETARKSAFMSQDTRIKKLEEKPVVQPVIQPVTVSGQIKTLTADIHDLKSKVLDLQCRSMKNNLVFTGLYQFRLYVLLSVNEQPVADKHHMTSLLFCLPHYRIQVFSSVVNFSEILFADGPMKRPRQGSSPNQGGFIGRE
jgi:hypothetical protein